MIRNTALIIPILAAALAMPATAQQRYRNWQTIGERTIAFGVDRDTIAVRGDRRHAQVRICALRRDFKLLDADVKFANGGEQDISESRTIRAGSCSGPVDLRGQRRDIAAVKLFYSRFNRGGAPIVRVQAR